ncbi:hypothetical protein HK104_010080 [Borealophlyctis nickersoniae]|nr:hypothetical protein HK104_010080 [Borealophlyctis nickersoniae]
MSEVQAADSTLVQRTVRQNKPVEELVESKVADSKKVAKRSPNALLVLVRTLRQIKAVLILICLLIYMLPVNILQILSLVVVPFSRKQSMIFNGKCAASIWLLMQWLFERVQKGKITHSGDVIPEKENAIVFSNHVSWSDFYLLHSVASRKKMQGSCKYFAKDSLKWLPGFGWGMWLMGMIMIKRNWTNDRSKIEGIFSAIKSTVVPVWIISYLEGTRITPKKLAESQAFAEKKGLPVLNNVLLPRTKGFVATVNAFRGTQIKAVYDFTIAYYDNKRGFQVAPSMIRIHSQSLAKDFKFHVHVRRFLIEDLPTDDDELAAWALERFVEKDKYLETLKKEWTENQTLLVEPSPFW